jgi:aspartate-semialdehyde dehydrogenase
MRVAVVGATGLVGSKMLDILAERDFPVTELIPVASENSVGKIVEWKGVKYPVVNHAAALVRKPEIALFSAGGATSIEWAPEYVKAGATVIDNSSAWRMDNDVPLIVPEVNGSILNTSHKIIANPNCSTIQLVMVLAPLHQLYRARQIHVCTYQSVTGTGQLAVQQLMNEREGKVGDMAYKYKIDLNLIPQIDQFTESGFTKEELKMTYETMKIMGDPEIQLCATCVRVPVIGGHSEACRITFEKEPDLTKVRDILGKTEGIVVKDAPEDALYPMPSIDAHNHDEVFVGRLRKDLFDSKSLHCWIVADNLRKGAATNAVQIAERIIRKLQIN